MSVRVGARGLGSAYDGSQRLGRIYRGNTELWRRAPAVPSDGLMRRTFRLSNIGDFGYLIGADRMEQSPTGREGTTSSPRTSNLTAIGINGGLRLIAIATAAYNLPNTTRCKIKWGDLPETDFLEWRASGPRFRSIVGVLSAPMAINETQRQAYIGQTIDVVVATDNADWIAIA